MTGHRTTRLAPSPTGALHLGNARTFLATWLMARQAGWRIALRIEDLDGPRIKTEAATGAIEDLQWLGLDWDGSIIRQSDRRALYQAAINDLMARGAVYPCVCSRRDVELAASAPHAEDGAAIYPGTCRGRYASIEAARRDSGREPSIRFMVPDGPDGIVAFVDRIHGARRVDVGRELGDFTIAKADGTPAYQLAVVVDDLDMRVTEVIRADDLLDSTPRQILLYRAMGNELHIPQYCHLPLVVGADGRRLAKRHGDTRISHYRRCGVTAGRMLALLARWCGMDVRDDVEAQELIKRFDVTKMMGGPTVFSAEDEATLLK